MEQLGIKGQKSFVKTACHGDKGNIEELKIHDIPAELAEIVNVLALDPKSAEQIASEANIRLPDVLKMLTRLELEGITKEISPGYFVRALDIHWRASDGASQEFDITLNEYIVCYIMMIYSHIRFRENCNAFW